MRIANMHNGPIMLVTFDLYDTLVEADPPRWERFAAATRRAGFSMSPEEILRADRAMEDHYTIENGRYPIRDRTEDDVQAFRLEQVRVNLEALELPTDEETVSRVQQYFLDETQNHSGWNYRAFDENIETLEYLESHGVMRAVISNADADVTNFCLHMGFAKKMDLIVTSAIVGWEKPDKRTFFAALNPLKVEPKDALHVGDQPLSDVKGARAIGMGAALIDRYGRHRDDEHDAIRVRSLMELAEMVVKHNQRTRVDSFSV